LPSSPWTVVRSRGSPSFTTVAVKIVAFSDGVARSYWADANADVIGDRGGERRDLLKAS
jgi:hypothetical protein